MTMDAKELNAWRAARAVAEAIWTAGQSPEAAGIRVSEGPGHPLVYDLRVPHGIASALNLGAGANEYAEERIGLTLGVAGFVTILQTQTGQDFTTVTIRLGSGAPAEAPAADGLAPASAVTERLERAAYLATRIDFSREFPVNTHIEGPCFVCREPVQPHRDLVAWSLEGEGGDTYPAVDLHPGCLAAVKRARETVIASHHDMNTAMLNLGRYTPKTSRQRESALAGIAQCDADWAAGELTTNADMILQGRDPYWRAGHQIRWLEHAATLPREQAVTSGSPDDAVTKMPGADDETARILAEHGTPEKLLGYRLTGAERRKREAYAAARAQRDADGKTPAAEQRYVASYEAAHAGWTAEVASAVAGYARQIGATAPPASVGTDDPTLPYNQGWHNGANMLTPEILTHRPSGYSDSQWREFVAGYAEAARLHAEATAAYARAVQELAQQNQVDRLAVSPATGTPAVRSRADAHPARPAVTAPGTTGAGPDSGTATQLPAGLGFAGAPGSPLPDRPDPRATGATTLPPTTPTRSRGRQ
jgi:hypothetical protein